MHPKVGFGWAKIGKRFKVPTASQHNQRLNVSGWVAPLLGKQEMVRTIRGDRKGFLKILRNLARRLKKYKVWLYVDGARWHKGEEVRKFIRRHPRIRLRYLPPYQPALNMQERIWRRIRYEATTSRWFKDLEVIWGTVQRTSRSWSRQKVMRLCNIT